MITLPVPYTNRMIVSVYDDKMALLKSSAQKRNSNQQAVYTRFQRKTSDMLKCNTHTQDVLLTLMHEI